MTEVLSCVESNDVWRESSVTVNHEFDKLHLTILKPNNSVRSLLTVIRDANTPRGDFRFAADRLIRLVVEEGLNLLPYTKKSVESCSGREFTGLDYVKGNCAVSIVRSGEIMESSLRDCCRIMRIGKIVIDRNERISPDHENSRSCRYANLPYDIDKCKVLLLYPIMSSGRSVIDAMRVLGLHNVKPINVVLLTIFVTPISLQKLNESYPGLRILTAEVHESAPTYFGSKYFGC